MNLVETWNTIKEASDYLNCSANSLNYNVKRENIYRNYVWRHEK